jgi:large subunit ribosomal protein L7e
MLVPESILKKRHDLDDIVRKRAASAQHILKLQKASGKKTFYVKKPETFLARGRARRNNAIRYRRVAKKGMQKRASDEKETATKMLEEDDQTTTVSYQSNSVGAHMVFVVRIRDDVGLPKVVKALLLKLRLKHVHEGVFLPYDEKTRKMLHLVEPFVVYGRPSKAVITDLIQRRGHGAVDNERVPLSDNTVIETALGDHSMLCVEDLVHEIDTVGPSFAHATKFLAPFRLVDSKTHFERRTLKVKDGKEVYGDKGEAINEYIKEVL